MSSPQDGPNQYTAYVIIEGKEWEVTGYLWADGAAETYVDETDGEMKLEIIDDPDIRFNALLDEAENRLTIPDAEAVKAKKTMITQYWDRY